MSDPVVPHPMRRRVLTGLGVAAIAAWVWVAPRLPGLWRNDALRFAQIPGAPGFRALEGAAGLSAAGAQSAILAGIDGPDPVAAAALAGVRADPCRALFGADPAPVPIALFSDFNCPNCPQMDANVTAVLARTPGASLHRHELPILGRTSDVAARAVLAAELQGGYAAMHERLTRTPAVTDLAFVRRMATAAGLDADRLDADMARPEIAAALDRSRALARHLGLIGTPATVIGRTVVLGILPEDDIAAIIAQEQQKGPPCLRSDASS